MIYNTLHGASITGDDGWTTIKKILDCNYNLKLLHSHVISAEYILLSIVLVQNFTLNCQRKN